MELEREKALLEEQQRKTQELRGRLTPENVENKEKIESDIQKAKIRKKDIQQEFHKRSIQVLEGTAGKLTEDEMKKVQFRKIKLEARLRKLISTHNLVVSSYEFDPMLEEKYQTLKQNMCNDIATCEVMLEPATGQSSDHDNEGEEIEKPLYLKFHQWTLQKENLGKG